MRPLEFIFPTSPGRRLEDGGVYSEQEELHRESPTSVLRDDASTEEPPAKRRRLPTVETWIADYVKFLNDKVPDDGKFPTGSSEEALRFATAIGTGYRKALRDLVKVTGPYCAYCDTIALASLQAAPMLPPKWYPDRAFHPQNILPACPACLEARGNRPVWVKNGADAAMDPANILWPNRFGSDQRLQGRLPYTYVLCKVDASKRAAQSLVRLGEAAVPLNKYEIKDLLRAYEIGRLWITDARIRGIHPGVPYVVDRQGNRTYIASLLSSHKDHPLGQGALNLIELFGLNGFFPTGASADWLDLRLQSRTICHLRAMTWHDRLNRQSVAGKRLDMIEMIGRCAAAAGHWGVWVKVFAGIPGLQAALAQFMPGTLKQDLEVY